MQIYSILSTMEQNLKRIYVLNMNFCSIEVVVYGKLVIQTSSKVLSRQIDNCFANI